MDASSPAAPPVAVVTGATSGIGRFTARGLARAGHRVVLFGRSAERLAETAAWVASGAPVPPVQTQQADFSSLHEVAEAAAQVRARHPAIAILVNNAGGMWLRRETSRDGHEMTFAVNHLAPFVLTRALLPTLTAAGPARIVTVASTAHLRGHVDFADLMATRRYSPLRAYAQSKLANVLFTRELARRLAGSGVTATCVHPGVVATGFAAKGGLVGLAWRLAGPFLVTPEQGARESLRAATDAGLAGVSGAYFARGREAPTSPEARDPAVAARLWQVSEALAPGLAG